MTAIARLHLTLLLLSAAATIAAAATTATEIPSAQLPLEARNAGSSAEEEEDIIATSYVLPNQIFNDGKPYYAGKDPISGQLDFSAKKPAGIETAANEVYDPKDKIVLSSSSPNIHDFLNLPVKYSSSKFVYPLVSSSYANLKYQGNNKNYVTNKKPTSVAAPPATPAPSSGPHYYTVPTTKLMAIAPTTSSTAVASAGTTTTTTTTGSTSSSTKPITTTTTTTTSKKPSTSSSIADTTPTTASGKLPVRPPLPTRYTTSTRKPIPITTGAPPPPTRFTTSATTRKKFFPTKKYIPTTTTPTAPATGTPPAAPLHFPDSRPLNASANATARPTSSGAQSPQPTPSTGGTTPTHVSSVAPATPPQRATTRQPIHFTENPSAAPAFTPTATRIPDLDAGAVYQTLGHKHSAPEAAPPKQPPMTLADIFNSLAEEESALSSNQAPGQGLDAQGNLMRPLSPARPAPFAMHGQRPPATPPRTTHPTYSSSSPANRPAIAGSGQGGGYSDEFVSYQVQQPNVMQYRPLPGAINNVVISPGQNSASFVLGSQQQVGVGASFGTVQKEPLFGQPPPAPVYGTVISEDLAPTTAQSGGANANGHQNGNFAQAPGGASASSIAQRPNVYREEPPAPPSPYQQLPLLGSNSKRPKPPMTAELQQPQMPGNYQHGPQPTALPQHATTTASSQQTTLSQDTKELLVSTNIRFPANSEDRSEELPTGPIASGPPAEPHVNGHAQPLSLQQIQSANPVVFPKVEAAAALPGDYQIQQHEVLTMNQHKQKLNFPAAQAPSGGEPSQHMEPPPPRFPGAEAQQRPQPKRPHGPPPYAYNEYTRKPIPSGIARPNPDRNLPNILPQFRPNAKISSGHAAVAPPTNFNQEPGNIRVPGAGPLKRPGAPQFAHRRQPLLQQQQQRYPSSRIADYPPPQTVEAANNRRIYRLPPSYGGHYARRPPPPHQLLRTADSYAVERHAPQPLPERMAAFEEDDLVINEPPQPVAPSQDAAAVDEAKLEPVVTLQMLQSQKKAVTLSNAEDTGAGEIQVPAAGDEGDEATASAAAQNGLYVVYPMKGAKLESATEEEKEPAEAPSGSGDYQNTPFTVVREPQEPILTLKSKKPPQSLQQQQQLHQQAKDRFPYAIEKPDASYSELAQTAAVGVLIAPRIVSGAGGAEAVAAPIAIAYTPTEPSPYRRYSNVNLATPVIGEIRPGDTQPDDDLDLRGKYADHEGAGFMAPFYPSISLGGGSSSASAGSNANAHNAPANKATSGWSILPSTTTTHQPLLYAKNKINRADVIDDGATETDDVVAPEATTKPFGDHFQPELQGGFKPIYPPGYKIDGDDDVDKSDNHIDTPVALPLQSIAQSSTSTTSTSSTSTTTATPPISKLASSTTVGPSSTAPPSNTPPAPTQRKKSVLETSLEALLFGDDADFQGADGEEARKKQSKLVGKMVPRMGPRNLKLS